jgi:alpha-galactosidase
MAFENRDKLPEGISGLSEKVEALGLKFGLWIEPEMVNKDSRFYETHPDWILSAPGRYDTPSRNQHVLDFSRKEIVDAVYGMLKDVIANARISYIKWDMNRYLTEC